MTFDEYQDALAQTQARWKKLPKRSDVRMLPVLLENCFEDALRSPDPVEGLRALAIRLRAEGQEQEKMIAQFEGARHN